MKRILVSACLAGTPVRYDGEPATIDDKIMLRWVFGGRVVRACPEVLGGLSVPRAPAEIVGGDGFDVLDGNARVVDENGADVTDAFVKGAQAALIMAQENDISAALLQCKSPSCGTLRIYDGTFSRTMKDGLGVTAALFERHGIRLFSKDELEDADNYLTGLK